MIWYNRFCDKVCLKQLIDYVLKVSQIWPWGPLRTSTVNMYRLDQFTHSHINSWHLDQRNYEFELERNKSCEWYFQIVELPQSRLREVCLLSLPLAPSWKRFVSFFVWFVVASCRSRKDEKWKKLEKKFETLAPSRRPFETYYKSLSAKPATATFCLRRCACRNLLLLSFFSKILYFTRNTFDSWA